MPSTPVSTRANLEFGAPSTGSKAVGTITFADGPLEAEFFTITDAFGHTATFEYDRSDGTPGVVAGRTAIPFVADATAATEAANAAAATVVAVNASALAIVAESAAGAVTLVQTEPVADGNTTIVGTLTNGTVVSFAGGGGEWEDRRRLPINGFPVGSEPGDRVLRLAKAMPVWFRVLQGGKLQVHVENNDGLNDLNYSFERSTDGKKFYPMTALQVGPDGQSAAAISALTAATPTPGVVRKGSRDVTLVVNPTTDAVVRLWAVGGGRGLVQLANEAILDPIYF